MTKHTIQLWMAEFHQKDYRSCWLLLDESERARSGQFKIEQVRQQYVITKGILKVPFIFIKNFLISEKHLAWICSDLNMQKWDWLWLK